MPLETKELLNFAKELCKQEGFKVTIIESAKGAAITGGTAFIGGLIGGPLGLAVGGICGSLVALANGNGKYRSLIDVMNDMTPEQHEKFANSIKKCVKDLEVEDASYLMPLVMSNGGLKDSIVKEIFAFFRNDMNIQVLH